MFEKVGTLHLSHDFHTGPEYFVKIVKAMCRTSVVKYKGQEWGDTEVISLIR